ncbi:dimethyl sulfoxide reductase chain A protein [Yersinia frederiksenii]|nr:dimethyl sulfoxide reductase chain A protein [Yersinia frederiksenii]
MNNNKRPITGSLSRREFIQTSAAVTGAAAIAGSITLPFSVQAAPEQATTSTEKETIKYSACLVNCGSRCPLKVHELLKLLMKLFMMIPHLASIKFAHVYGGAQ